MHKHIADKWVDALRSGKYRQAEGTLRTSDGSDACYCCLGVLCDLYAKEDPSLSAWTDDNTFLGEESHLPTAVMNWAGVRHSNGALRTYVDVPCLNDEFVTTVDNLVDMNDEGCSFDAIADIIDKHVEEL